jgi:hypothetical protein
MRASQTKSSGCGGYLFFALLASIYALAVYCVRQLFIPELYSPIAELGI